MQDHPGTLGEVVPGSVWKAGVMLLTVGKLIAGQAVTRGIEPLLIKTGVKPIPTL
ncbi:hypothetical protein GA0116948_101194 [Chitinophaga costaii]|uniref:Uncharacterized protein n=1 Tax=Chitinophaga costaii TaxID=1335309 RepID=A0A1C3Z118_9BACT|nr:hypothetical protein GA0116948_101194 [Chitinophaga costaii]